MKTLRHDFVDFLFNEAGEPITLGEYFSKEVLLHPITGHDDTITVKQSCKFPEGRYMASATKVTTSWPQHFTIESDMCRSSLDAPVHLIYETEFKVVDLNNTEVKYALVGCVLHWNNQFSIHKQAFQSTVSNIVGNNKKLQPVTGSSLENASGWLAKFHLNQHLNCAGEA